MFAHKNRRCAKPCRPVLHVVGMALLPSNDAYTGQLPASQKNRRSVSIPSRT